MKISSYFLLTVIIIFSLALVACHGDIKPYVNGKKTSKFKAASYPYGIGQRVYSDEADSKGHPYGLSTSFKERNLKKNSKHPYNLINSGNKSAELVLDHPYGLQDEIHEQNRVKSTKHPYGLSDTALKKSLLKKHPYGLFTDPKEKMLAKKTKHPYGLSSNATDTRLASTGLPYHDLHLTKREDEILNPYEHTGEEVFSIDKNDFLQYYELYKNPKIKALVIGNQKYRNSSVNLKYVENDIELFSSFLNSITNDPGADVDVLSNQSYDDFKDNFKSFVEDIEEDDFVIIYYSGHMKKNGVPIFTDMKSPPADEFHNLMNSIKNDSAFIVDGSHIEEVKRKIDVEEASGLNSRILRIYSSLVPPPIKEGNYIVRKNYNRRLNLTYSLVNQLGASEEGNGIFTLVFTSFFADFFFQKSGNVKPEDFDSEISFDTLYSYMETKISQLEESGARIERPTKIPGLGTGFRNYQNNYILYKALKKRKDFSREENALLKALNKKGRRLQSEGKYQSAIGLFLAINKKTGGEGYGNSKARLAELYILAGSEQEDENIEESFNLFEGGVEYKSKKDKSSLLSLQSASSSRSGIEKTLQNGYDAYNRGDYEAALKHFTKAKKGYEALGDQLGVAICLNNIGACYNKLKKYDKALSSHEESLAIKQQYNDQVGIAYSKNNIGVIYHQQGKYSQAIGNLEQSAQIYKSQGQKLAEAKARINLAKSYAKNAQKAKALESQKKAIKILQEMNSPRLKEEEANLKNFAK